MLLYYTNTVVEIILYCKDYTIGTCILTHFVCKQMFLKFCRFGIFHSGCIRVKLLLFLSFKTKLK